MSEQERNALRELAGAFEKLPPSKQQYFNGYADAVADLMEAKAEDKDDKCESA